MKTPTTKTVDAAAILSSIWAKNALRRTSGLPLWPVRETFQRELRRARWRLHVENHLERIEAEVVAQQRAKHGPEWPSTWGGRMVLSAIVQRVLKVSFSHR
jgi:hypothetical protein